eukprot:CAMPEP_0172788538 /NCGR_PEP_ID=MMETSP1074-20121228/207005_1 /TAXON_ID=2916 /ORGANISM="Ceratium fusus, Strain PA161109" /LENGTH=79 /DNA_ID=CAMNT_0013625567 /DNA_START=530 /DNA_END=766 /DNA_ORIENTATION=-
MGQKEIGDGPTCAGEDRNDQNAGVANRRHHDPQEAEAVETVAVASKGILVYQEENARDRRGHIGEQQKLHVWMFNQSDW